ncbi:alcohol dehydrogenase catalytic domain-containing protein [Microlunatus soli]|uniref:alcohol dehydrogenase n=1 Tax=Microlunatus soli TaxID=630515 RepID=A0A1H1ZG81_9ACTN|nr:alcohol dehydrogenase catalytic domain-containing protein [Microlunatus soli]SDT32206.1 D-arabinose 1-dehydrogenase, Zn-dependent alcohol dehydrogenase family [Microlunatus soli]
MHFPTTGSGSIVPASPGRQTARVAVFDHGRVQLQDVELPHRTAGEIDVAISSAAICGSDLHTVAGHRSAPELAALGHEGVGVVTDLDPGSTDARGMPLKVGDRVVLSMIAFCGACDRCRAGLTMKCRRLQKYGHDSVRRPPYATGMLADRVRLLPGVPVVALPDAGADDEILVSAGCATATAAAVVGAAGARSGEPVLVFGAGAVGFFCAAMLATAGCRPVVRDPNPGRLALLGPSGARPDTGEHDLFPVVIEASGNPAAFVDALAATAVGGHLVAAGSVSPGATSLRLDPADLVTRSIRLTGVHNYRTADFLTAVDWLQSHGADAGVAGLMSPAHPLSDIDDAFEEMRSGAFARVLVRPEAG